MSRRPLIAALVALPLAAGATAALAAALHTQTASAGGITATFSFRGSLPDVTDAHLQIVKDGQPIYDAPVTSPACGKLCGPAEFGAHAASVGIVPLAPGSPEILLQLFTGGANCCFIDQVFSYDPGTMGYLKTEHNFADAGALIKRINGQWRFESADPRFKYVFTDGAASGEPLQIYRWTAPKFADVTRRYPGLIAKDAAFWLKAFRRHLADGLGVLAAWAADEELVHHDALVQSTLAHELAAGHLRAQGGYKGGAQYIGALNRFLRRNGYTR